MSRRTRIDQDNSSAVSGWPAQPIESEGFESGLGAWSIPGPPPGSPTTAGDFERSSGLLSSAVTTEDSVLLGFGLEQIASATERAAVVGRAMEHLFGSSTP